jgi:sugar phosphate isomerase/epimerase
MTPRIGIDSYSYHRLLGEIRPGEDLPVHRFPRGSLDAVAHARTIGADGISLETSFLAPPFELEVAALRDEVGTLELVLAWGHRHGLEFGANDAALSDLLDWLTVAARLGCGVVRCVAASPGFRGRAPVAEQIERTVSPLRVAAAHARELGIALAVENHGDLRAGELEELLDRVGDDTLGVCFDTANALRVGDDPVHAAALLAPRTMMIHLKDVEPLDGVTDPIAGPRSLPYAEGVVPLHEVLSALDAGGFDGLVCVELGQLGAGADELALVEQGVAWLRRYASSNG